MPSSTHQISPSSHTSKYNDLPLAVVNTNLASNRLSLLPSNITLHRAHDVESILFQGWRINVETMLIQHHVPAGMVTSPTQNKEDKYISFMFC